MIGIGGGPLLGTTCLSYQLSKISLIDHLAKPFTMVWKKPGFPKDCNIYGSLTFVTHFDCLNKQIRLKLVLRIV